MGQEWILCARFMEFMEFSKFEVSRNSGFEHQQELPLQISIWLNDYQALQYLSASLTLTERWQSESLNTPRSVFHLGNIFHWASTQYGLP